MTEDGESIQQFGIGRGDQFVISVISEREEWYNRIMAENLAAARARGDEIAPCPTCKVLGWYAHDGFDAYMSTGSREHEKDDYVTLSCRCAVTKQAWDQAVSELVESPSVP